MPRLLILLRCAYCGSQMDGYFDAHGLLSVAPCDNCLKNHWDKLPKEWAARKAVMPGFKPENQG